MDKASGSKKNSSVSKAGDGWYIFQRTEGSLKTVHWLWGTSVPILCFCLWSKGFAGRALLQKLGNLLDLQQQLDKRRTALWEAITISSHSEAALDVPSVSQSQGHSAELVIWLFTMVPLWNRLILSSSHIPFCCLSYMVYLFIPVLTMLQIM